VRVFDVNDDNTLSGGEIWATATNGGFDGFRFDEAGRIWMSAADGVHCLHPDGTLIGKVLVPELTANVVFGGRKRNRLFICGTTSLYSILLPVNGVKTF
jgi:gluconolactonase